MQSSLGAAQEWCLAVCAVIVQQAAYVKQTLRERKMGLVLSTMPIFWR